jgi:hypothetical protein
MKRYRHLFIILLLLLSCRNAIAQQRNNLIVAKDHLILLLDLRSSKTEIDSILIKAGLKNFNVPKILKGDFSALTKDGWNMAGRQANVVQFDRSLTDLNENPQSHPYQLTTRLQKFDGKPGYPEQVLYGINKYARITVYELPSGFTRFLLPGYSKAKRVLLSGSFNNWSTLKGLMKLTDAGWAIDTKLAPGAYEYKYIIDGKWTTDPNNLQQVDDGVGHFNSIYFKYNYTFKLSGFAAARKIIVAGSFNKWNANELIFFKTGNSWERGLYLNDGMHTYRFLVDANPVTIRDNAGNINSALNLGETLDFKLSGHKDAKRVFVAGNFNNWKPDELSMKRSDNGWELPLIMPAGNYNYKFIIDGNWITDPANHCYSTDNGNTNSFIAVRPNHTFKLKGYDNAKKIVFAGDLNNWDPNGYTMIHNGDEWSIKLYLKPGKYRYKFIVDGKWILDPANKLWEQNEFDTGNSVLWME